jgi:uncharacterized protein YigE (DUF2233 family)
MVRESVCAMIALSFVAAGLSKADDATKKDNSQKQHLQATITKVDAQKDTVTVKTMDKSGKQQDKTLQLAKDAKYLDASGKDLKLDAFKNGDDVCITQKDDKVTELKKHAAATITKVDAKAGTITVKMTDKNGKDVEKTFRLVEDSEYLDNTGRVAVLDIFQSGDDILYVETDGTIQGMKKAEKQAKTSSKDNSDKDTKKAGK